MGGGRKGGRLEGGGHKGGSFLKGWTRGRRSRGRRSIKSSAYATYAHASIALVSYTQINKSLKGKKKLDNLISDSLDLPQGNNMKTDMFEVIMELNSLSKRALALLKTKSILETPAPVHHRRGQLLRP